MLRYDSNYLNIFICLYICYKCYQNHKACLIVYTTLITRSFTYFY